MQSLLHSDDRETFQTWLAVVGAFCVLIFLFFPLKGRSAHQGNIIYMIEGGGEQWLLLAFSTMAALLVYFRLLIGSVIAGCAAILMTLLITVYSRFIPSYLNLGADGRGHLYAPPGKIQLLILAVGVLLLLAPGGMELWEKWDTHRSKRIKPAPIPPPRYFDPRSVNPQATTGFCYNCGAKNPLSRSQCLQCTVNLSWIGATASTAVPKTTQHPKPKQDFYAMPSVKVDWSVLAIGFLSFILWPLGLVLFFAFSKTDDEKANAAIIGACLALAVFVLRFIYLMATAVQ